MIRVEVLPIRQLAHRRIVHRADVDGHCRPVAVQCAVGDLILETVLAVEVFRRSCVGIGAVFVHGDRATLDRGHRKYAFDRALRLALAVRPHTRDCQRCAVGVVVILSFFAIQMTNDSRNSIAIGKERRAFIHAVSVINGHGCPGLRRHHHRFRRPCNSNVDLRTVRPAFAVRHGVIKDVVHHLARGQSLHRRARIVQRVGVGAVSRQVQRAVGACNRVARARADRQRVAFHIRSVGKRIGAHRKRTRVLGEAVRFVSIHRRIVHRGDVDVHRRATRAVEAVGHRIREGIGTVVIGGRRIGQAAVRVQRQRAVGRVGVACHRQRLAGPRAGIVGQHPAGRRRGQRRILRGGVRIAVRNRRQVVINDRDDHGFGVRIDGRVDRTGQDDAEGFVRLNDVILHDLNRHDELSIACMDGDRVNKSTIIKVGWVLGRGGHDLVGHLHIAGERMIQCDDEVDDPASAIGAFNEACGAAPGNNDRLINIRSVGIVGLWLHLH